MSTHCSGCGTAEIGWGILFCKFRELRVATRLRVAYACVSPSVLHWPRESGAFEGALPLTRDMPLVGQCGRLKFGDLVAN